MLKRCLAIILFLCFASPAIGEVLSPRDTLYFEYPTMTDYDLSDTGWDTVYVVITRGGSLIDTIWLVGNGDGLWTGSYYLGGLSPGSYNRLFCADYGGDINGEGYPFSIRDTTELQGSASGLTITDIREAVHFAFTSTYGGSTGTMGKAIVDAASCNPSGSNTITITLKRDSDSTAIIGGTVQVKTDGTFYYIGDTDNNGMVSFLSDNDTLFVYVDAHPITFTTPETLRIDGNEDVTYYGTPFDPGSPASANLCRVYGWVKDINDNLIVGAKVEMSITSGPVRYGNVPISRYIKTTTTNSSGYWYLNVYRTADLTPATTKYRVYIYIPSGEVARRDITVAGDTQEFTW